ncbi:MAG: hypothetical protein Q4F72_06145 [Desulfovibrionaceae bacterium]|nr:hypothetical protein [Desulfovibrionaceae bacterium]
MTGYDVSLFGLDDRTAPKRPPRGALDRTLAELLAFCPPSSEKRTGPRKDKAGGAVYDVDTAGLEVRAAPKRPPCGTPDRTLAELLAFSLQQTARKARPAEAAASQAGRTGSGTGAVYDTDISGLDADAVPRRPPASAEDLALPDLCRTCGLP